jgi:hypothetical protein
MPALREQRHQQLVGLLSHFARVSREARINASIEAFLNRSLPTQTWLVKDGVEKLVNRRTHRKVRNGPEHRLTNKEFLLS